MIMEAEKFHSLPSASQRNTKAYGIIQFQSKGLRTRALSWLKDKGLMSQLTKESRFSLPPPFRSSQALHGLDDAHPHP